jgi:hypothetical protein
MGGNVYVLGAILALTLVLQAVVAVVDSVLNLLKLKPVIDKIPIIGAHWGLGISILMVWVAEVEPLNNWVGMRDKHWLHVVINGAVIYGAIPLKDAVVSMVNKGLRA